MRMGRIFEIKHFAVHDGDGIRTTVFFQGCPLRCEWCHNPEGLIAAPRLSFIKEKCIGCGECRAVCQTGANGAENCVFEREKCIACGACERVCLGGARKLYGRETTVEELLSELLADRAFYENSGGGVTLSGGECLAQADFCAELLQVLQEEGIRTAVDTCGFVPRAALQRVMPYTDVFLYDIKAYHEDVHIRCTGQSNRVILENLRYLEACGKEVEIRIPYVPDRNDAEMGAIADFLAPFRHVCRVRVLPYHNFAGSKYAALGMTAALPSRLPKEAEIAAAQALFARS